jgi:hypothetical protein
MAASTRIAMDRAPQYILFGSTLGESMVSPLRGADTSVRY